MLFETLAVVGLLLGAAAVLSLGKIKEWLRSRRATSYGELIKREMRNGSVEVIAIGLTSGGTETGRKTWTAKSLDQDLAATFGYRDRIRISV
jgi:hypothetical protein